MATHPIETFADAVLHELRTPLAVVVGEVDLALARDRPAAAYRDTLVRIAESVAELVDLTVDLSSIVAATDPACPAPHSTPLDAVLAMVAERYGTRRGAPIEIEAGATPAIVLGAAEMLAGALSLLVEHALKHCPRGSRVALRHRLPDGPGGVDLTIEAAPAPLASGVWRHAADGGAHVNLRRMRLEAAAILLRRCGGSVAPMDGAAAGGLVIRLRSL